MQKTFLRLAFMYVEPVSDAVTSTVVVVPAILPQRCASTRIYLATCRVHNTRSLTGIGITSHVKF